jgi:hypothetical protein
VTESVPVPRARTPYFAGENRALDVAKLRTALPLTQGSTVPHEAIEELLQLPRQSHIYRYVTTQWRKAVFAEHQIVILAVRGVGFYIQPARAGIQTLERAFLGTQKRATRLVDQHSVMPVHELSQLEAAMYYHNNRFLQVMKAEIRKVVKALTPPKPQEQNPKRGAGGEG